MTSSSKPEPHLNPPFLGLVSHSSEPHFRKLRTLDPMKNLSSYCITIRYIRKRCTFACSFTSCSPICDPINIGWVTAKHAQFSAWFHTDSTNIDEIANWRIRGERALQTALFTYISYYNTMWTQILNWSQSSELAKLLNWSKNQGFGPVRFLDCA